MQRNNRRLFDSGRFEECTLEEWDKENEGTRKIFLISKVRLSIDDKSSCETIFARMRRR